MWCKANTLRSWLFPGQTGNLVHIFPKLRYPIPGWYRFLVAKVTFDDVCERLLSCLAERVSNGEFSERRLAAKLGLSQPQIHRLLNGSRRLTRDVAERIRACLDLSIADLLHGDEIAPRAAEVNLPRKQPDRQELQPKIVQRRTG